MYKYIKTIKNIFDSMNFSKYYEAPDKLIDMNSLTMIQLILNLELAFGFEFDLEELEFNNFKDFNQICKTVLAKGENNGKEVH